MRVLSEGKEVPLSVESWPVLTTRHTPSALGDTLSTLGDTSSGRGGLTLRPGSAALRMMLSPPRKSAHVQFRVRERPSGESSPL